MILATLGYTLLFIVMSLRLKVFPRADTTVLYLLQYQIFADEFPPTVACQFMLMLFFLCWLSIFYTSKIRSGIWPERTEAPDLSERSFRFFAKWYGLKIPDTFNYAAYRQLRERFNWILMQDKNMRKMGNHVGEESTVVPIFSWWCILRVTVPQQQETSVAKEVLLLGFFLLQGSMRFVLCWIDFYAERDLSVLEWDTGQIIPVVMLASFFLTWLSLSSGSNQAAKNGSYYVPFTVLPVLV
jgi:hypothetical protein